MGENDLIVEAWNTVLFDKFMRFKHLLVAGLAGHSNEILSRRPFREGQRVLDVGCGFGDSTLKIAEAVGRNGAAVGVDCAENFVRRATDEARAAEIPNATFFTADVQTDNLRGRTRPRVRALRYDVLHGARRRVAERSQVAQARRRVHAGRVAQARGQPVAPRRRAPREGDRARRVAREHRSGALRSGAVLDVGAGHGELDPKSAGFSGITFERFDTDICIGRDIDDAIEFAMALGPAGEIIRLAGSEGERLKPEVSAALRETLARCARPDGVWAPSSTWFITARA